MIIPNAIAVAVAISLAHSAHARSYVPIGAPESNYGKLVSVKSADRPNLPGARPVELEMLEDALRRKMPHAIGTSREKAQASIVRNSLRNPVKQSHMLGTLAEAVYLEKNKAWGYVASPIASQHDLYVWRQGRRSPVTAQVKTHVSGDPLTYASDMRSDYRSDIFIVPDDHADKLKDHWDAQARIEEEAGKSERAKEARRQSARIRKLGARYSDLSASLSRAARFAQREQHAGYISLGAATALAFGPYVTEAMQAQSSLGTLLPVAHGASVLAAERATTYMLTRNASTIYASGSADGASRLGPNAIKGSLRGNAITGGVLLAVDTAFSVYEHGGTRAFQNGGFYTNLGGGVSAVSLGLPAGAYVLAFTGQPYLGFFTAFTVGTVAYIGGSEVSRKLLEAIGPDFLYQEEIAALESERKRIGCRLEYLQGAQHAQFVQLDRNRCLAGSTHRPEI